MASQIYNAHRPFFASHNVSRDVSRNTKHSKTVSGLMRKVFSTGLNLNGTPELPYVLQSRRLFEQQQHHNALHAPLHDHISGRTGVRDYCMPYRGSHRHGNSCINTQGSHDDSNHYSGGRSANNNNVVSFSSDSLNNNNPNNNAAAAGVHNDENSGLDADRLQAGFDFLKKRDDIWRGNAHARGKNVPGQRGKLKVTATGYEDLDDLLFTGGWPAGTLTEIHCGEDGSSALPLVLPALSRLTDSETHADKWAVWVAPPHVPYAPALRAADINPDRMLVVHPRQQRARHINSAKSRNENNDRQNDRQNDHNDMVWAVEQALRSGTASVVLAWFDQISFAALRRLQLAAEAGGTTALIFRPQKAAKQNSPAALRLSVTAKSDSLEVSVLKQRGAWADDSNCIQLKLI